MVLKLGLAEAKYFELPLVHLDIQSEGHVFV